MENKNLPTAAMNGAVASNTLGSIESNRAIAEVQGQVLMAKQFPRNQIQARRDIMEACKRKKLAETAIYSYPRGGKQIEGPSIRLAEMIAQYWGNIDYGIIELDQRTGIGKKAGKSIVMAYCRDIQTNTRRQMVFTVPHVRYTRSAGNKTLSDPRDIYEITANMGARRLRACIMGIIPGDIIEEALEACNKTLLGNNDEPLVERIKKMVGMFEGIGVSQTMLEKRIGHNMEATLIIEVVQLGKIYKSIVDGMSVVTDWFDLPAAAKKEKSDLAAATEKAKRKTAPVSEQEAKEETAPPSPVEEEQGIEVRHLAEINANDKYLDAIQNAIADDEFSTNGIHRTIETNDEKTAKKIIKAINKHERLLWLAKNKESKA